MTETNEANNSLTKSIQVGGDLAASRSSTAPAKAGAGSSIPVSDTDHQPGAGPVASTATRFYLSANSVWDAGDTLLSGPQSVPIAFHRSTLASATPHRPLWQFLRTRRRVRTT